MFITKLQLDNAYAKLIKQRNHLPPNSDIWHLRFHWKKIKIALLTQINQQQFQLSPMQVITKANGEQVVLWSSLDALVIYWLVDYLTPTLPTHSLCEHIKGHQGGSSSVHRLHRFIHSSDATFVLRTDIKGYYANIHKPILLHQLRQYVDDPYILSLLSQFIYYSVDDGGWFHTPKQGIARSSPLSPLLAAFHLYCIDEYFSSIPHCRYARYMDDFIILTKKRWHLRKAIATLNRYFQHFGFTQHPDKTFIGRIAKGFDWMGFWFTDKGCTGVAPRAVQNHLTKLHRLYEQTRHLPAQEQAKRVSSYVTRWRAWCDSHKANPSYHCNTLPYGPTMAANAESSFALDHPSPFVVAAYPQELAGLNVTRV